MADDARYNGWSNYPTWNWKLWIDNDQGLQEYWQEQTQDCVTSNDDDDNASNDLAHRLESDADEQQEQAAGNSGPLCDILSWAMGQIDWREIADAMIGDLDDAEKRELRGQDDDPQPEPLDA